MKLLIRGILIGILIGQLIMVPHVIKWMRWPLIYTLPVPYLTYLQIGNREYITKDVITKEYPEPTEMVVRIKSVNEVREDCEPVYGDCETTHGFEYYDKETKRHIVTSIDDADILQHEIRHVFEGPFHRNPGDDLFCPTN